MACKKRGKIKTVNKMALSRFATLNDEEIPKLLTEKTAKIHKMLDTKACKTILDKKKEIILETPLVIAFSSAFEYLIKP